MSTIKRKMSNLGLQRRVRPRVEPEPESDVEESGSEAPSEEDVGSHASEDESDEDASDMSDGGEEVTIISGPQKSEHETILTILPGLGGG